MSLPLETWVPFAVFEALFASSIRVRLDWDRARGVVDRVRLTVEDGHSVGRWLCPWYVDDGGNEVFFGHPQARPLTVQAAASSPPAARKARIAALAAAFTAGERSPIMVASLHLRDRRVVVLDGSHRLAALHRGDFDISVLAFEVSGADDILPDARVLASS